MTIIYKNLKVRALIAFVAFSSLLIAAQPAITYACSGTHCGG